MSTKQAIAKKKTPAKKASRKSAKAANTRARSAHKGSKAAKAGKATTARAGSRREAVVALISRPNGATLAKIMEATGWQAHSVRGMIATLGKTMKIESLKSEAGERTYQHQA